MRRAWCVLLALCACDRVLGLSHVPAIDAPELGAGLVADYPFETLGPPSACAADVTGHGHDAACMIGTPAAVPGRVGMAFQLAAPTVLAVPYAGELDPTAAITIAFWVHIDVDSGTYQCVVNKVLGDALDDTYQICPSPEGTLFKLSENSITVMPGITLGAWHHVAMTWDGVDMIGWLDGTLVIEEPVAMPANDAHGLEIGADLDAGAVTAPLAGLLDELRIYDRALDAAEIHALANP